MLFFLQLRYQMKKIIEIILCFALYDLQNKENKTVLFINITSKFIFTK